MNSMEFEVSVKENKVIMDDLIFTTGTVNNYVAVLTLPEEYNGLTVYMLFNGVRSLVEDNKCTLPEFLIPGTLVVGVIAYEESDGVLLERYSPQPYRAMIEKGSYVSETKDIVDVAADGYEKLINASEAAEQAADDADKATDTALAAAQTAADVANAVLEAKNNGEFIGAQGEKGDKGDKGDTGAQGVQGEKGEKGDTGPQGEPGADGAAATVAVGTVTTGEPDTPASVTNSGTQNAAVLDFVIPKGVKGDKGDTGDTGAQGIQGEKGDKGDTGEKGTGIDTWMTGLDLSENSSSSNAFNIFTLDDGAYIVTAGGYISNSSASAGTIEIDQGAYIVVNSSRATINSSNACYNIGISDNSLSGGMIPIYSEMNDALSSKADAIKIITRTAAGGNLNLQDKRDFRFEALTTLNFSLPDTVPDIFECNVTFESGETATILSYPADAIEFIGDECDEDGDFVPAANTTYEINIKNLGYGRIRAFVKALEAQPVTVTPDYFISARYNDWVRGAVTNGVFQDSSSRIRSGHHYYATGTEVIVKIPSGYQMTVSFYSKSGNSYVFQGALDGWLTGTASFTIEDGVNYVAFMYGLVNNTVAEPADGLNVEFLIKQPAQT